MVRREGDKFVVYSESGRRFGAYPTEEAAKKRLGQMEYFKKIKKEAGERVFKSLGRMARHILKKV